MLCLNAYTSPFIFIMDASTSSYFKIVSTFVILKGGIYFFDRLYKLWLKDFNADYNMISLASLGILE